MDGNFSDRQVDTILAALRYWQQCMDDSTAWALHVMPHHFEHGPPLLAAEVDDLCDYINTII